MKIARVALLALLAGPLSAQEFPGGRFAASSIVTVIDWEGAPAILLVGMAPGAFNDHLFLTLDKPTPGAWSFKLVAAAAFDSRACALNGPYGPAVAMISACYDSPGVSLPPMNATGFVVRTWAQPYVSIASRTGPGECAANRNDTPWVVGYCNSRSHCPEPCPPHNYRAGAPELYALVLKVVST